MFSLFSIPGLFLPQLGILSLGDMTLLWVDNKRRLGELLLYVFFGLFGRKEIKDCLKMRRSFLKNLSLWIKVYIDGSPMFLIDFIDWLDSC